jgi:SAM-dependent methyltransferase
LQHKPLDRQLLDRFVASAHAIGPACDKGCGPKHVARYLHERGIQVCGVDLSPGTVERASRLTSGIAFRQGDMLALDVPDAAWAGMVAFYSIIHIRRNDMARAFSELPRVLQPGGLLLSAFHFGDDAIHLEEWWGHSVCVDSFFLRPDDVADHICAAGFVVQEIIKREPYPDVEHQSRRAYILAYL